MLREKLQDELNRQVNAELYSAYLYLSMAAYFESANLSGFAHWMRAQHEEEHSHALKLFDYVTERGGRVHLQAIKQPPVEFTSPVGVMEQTLAHERAVTGMIHAIYELAAKEQDYPTQVMLQWFIDEQVEEEKTAADILGHLKLIGNDGAGLLMLDARLGERKAKG
ncbi:MAG: ferritin [Dehalococcoidia bacterium]|nr:ferritin [Dehalococcoidia bacterium]